MARLEPQELSFVDTAPFRGSATIVSPVPAPAVFAVLRDHRRWPEWVGAGVTDVEPTSDPDWGVGSTRTVTFFRYAQVEESFVGWEEPNLWAFTGVAFRPKVFSKLVECFTTEVIDENNCRVEYRVGADFPALMRPLGSVFMPAFARAAQSALKRLSAEAVRRHR